MRQVVKKTDSCVGQLANVILLISIFFSPGHYCIWWYFAIMILHFDMESALWIEYFQVNHAIANQTIFAAI